MLALATSGAFGVGLGDRRSTPILSLGSARLVGAMPEIVAPGLRIPMPGATESLKSPRGGGLPVRSDAAKQAKKGCLMAKGRIWKAYPLCCRSYVHWTRCSRWQVIFIVTVGFELWNIHEMTTAFVAEPDFPLGMVNYRRSTKLFEDGVAGGAVGLRVLSKPNVMAVEGGLPIVADGKVIGAIGVSGIHTLQDAQVARAGLAAMS